MGSTEQLQEPLLDARLRFPVHALPNERVVWTGTAAPSAYRAAILSVLLSVGGLVFGAGLLLLLIPFDDRPCRVAMEAEAGGKPRHRDCTPTELAQRRQDAQQFRSSVVRYAFSIVAFVALCQLLANALRRRHLVYVVTNERVVVQDGYLGLRLDTIDLDHVVSITAKAGMVERWFGLKSISVTVPGQKAAIWQRGVMLANAIELWGLPAQDPALSQLLNAWLPRPRS